MRVPDAIRARRMVRNFTDQPLAPGLLDELCDLARRAPSAGNTQAVSFLVLDTPDAVGRYWDQTLPAPRRPGFRWPGLITAPALMVVAVDPSAYLARYSEPDKAASGLGQGTEAWAVPYWWVDAGAAIEHLLLAAVDVGLGGCLFGLFEHERAVAEAFGVPETHRLVGTIALGHPAADERGRSADRVRPALGDVVHRGTW